MFRTVAAPESLGADRRFGLSRGTLAGLRQLPGSVWREHGVALPVTGPGVQLLLAAGSTAGRALVVIPSYGVAHLTRDVVSDVLREPTRVVVFVIDNEGDYRPVDDEVVWRPGGNLGWLRASNAGMRLASETGATSAVLLNNDTRLSDGFFAGLVDAQRQTCDAVIVPL